MTFRSTRSLAECRQVARVLQGYLDGELDAGRARRVAEHLEDCRRCGLEASVYEAIRVAIAAVGTQAGGRSGAQAGTQSGVRAGPVSDDAVERLRAFADRLAEVQP